MSPLPAARLRRAQLVDRLVGGVITSGGSLILLAVALLMVFLLIECLPLLKRSSFTGDSRLKTATSVLAALEDEYRESVFLLGADGVVERVRQSLPAERLELDGISGQLRMGGAAADGRLLAAVDEAGNVHVWSVRINVEWKGQDRVLVPRIRRLFSHGAAGQAEPERILAVAGSSDEAFVLLGTEGGAALVRGDEYGASVGLIDASGSGLAGAMSRDGSQVWIASQGRLLVFRPGTFRDGDRFEPLAASVLSVRPTAAATIVGDVTCLIGDAGGTVTAWQLLPGGVAGTWVVDLAGRFEGADAVTGLAASNRDKSFLVLRERTAEIAHLTSRRILAELPDYPGGVVTGGLAPRRDGVFAVAGDGVVHRWGLAMAHPAVTLNTLFRPVRYEGYSAPSLVWQSTGATADFEPKLSLVPLILGTFKGALYALLFSAPCALLAALYVSQFAPVRLRQVSKPVVELMAALPSVVVGFLAALFLAPLLQRNLVGTLAALVVLPLAITVVGLAWGAAPLTWRRRLATRGELALVAVLIAVPVFVVYSLQDRIETALFGGDLQTWLLQVLGVTYDQRNAVVVGFALGFAVIPIIFTLAEDAFSNVPPSLISASLALGATPWQAARTVAIPAASPGLFAAVMIGLGRAVGETMIVLMATGNTPILSMSPFNGMRTMSANIAVELPEAAYGGTLYRVLILTALLLFAATFFINTVAVLVSARLRKRFGRLAA